MEWICGGTVGLMVWAILYHVWTVIKNFHAMNQQAVEYRKRQQQKRDRQG